MTRPLTQPAQPAAPRGQLQILTPEGVLLRFKLADIGDRLSAFLIDLFFLVLMVLGLLIGAFLLALIGAPLFLAGGWSTALLVVAIFLLRTFYFAFYELRWRGTTPGKRAIKLRVIDRAGGPLRPDAIMVRNLMREIEFFLPLTVLLAAKSTQGVGQWTMLAMLSWTGLFTLFPLFNRDRLRLGDFVAGTCVIAAPQAALLQDLALRDDHPHSSRSAVATADARYVFTQQQLDVYGVMELQALEEVLRRTDVNAADTRREVAKRIRSRIAWQDPPGASAADFDAAAFLAAFYAAQRGKLEKNMLFGIHRKDKNDRGETRSR